MTETIKIKDSAKAKPGSLGALYDLLDKNLPAHRNRLNQLNVKKIGDDIDVSSQAIYRWFENNRVPQRQAQNLVDLSGSTLTIESLAPFVFK